MKRYILLSFTVLFGHLTYSQLSGSYNIPADYTTIRAAVKALNTQGVGTNGVTFNVSAGHTEDTTAAILLTATGTASDPVVFQKSGTGANPVVTRTGSGSVATSVLGGQGDGVIIIQGSDYITFDSINISTANQGIEYGYFLRKGSGTDGCKYVAIKNATITMTKGTSAYVTGIYSSNLVSSSTAGSAAGVTVSNNTGRHEYVSFTGNNISNVFSGIILRGYDASSPYSYYDQNFTVGAGGEGNTIQNFAGNSTNDAYGIYIWCHNNVNVSYNTVNNTAGGGSNFTGFGGGIVHSKGLNSSGTISDNIINVSSSASGASDYLRGIGIILATTTGTGVFTCNNNTISAYMNANQDVYCLASSGDLNSITFDNNTFINCYFYQPGQPNFGSALIYVTGNPSTVNVTGNQTSGDIINTSQKPFYGYYHDDGTGDSETISDNTFSNITCSNTAGSLDDICCIWSTTSFSSGRVCSGNTMTGVAGSGGTASDNEAIHLENSGNQVFNNIIHDNSGGSMIGIFTKGTNSSVYNNDIYNLTSTNGYIYGIRSEDVGTSYNYDNEVYDLTSSASLYGIINAGSTGIMNCHDNEVSNLTSNGATSYIIGIYNYEGDTIYCFDNLVYNLLSTSSTTPNVSGIANYTPLKDHIYNNYISDLQAPNANSQFVIRGVYLMIPATAHTSKVGMYYNTIYLDATSSGTDFGTAGIYQYVNGDANPHVRLDMRNNIIVNNSTSNGFGSTVAFHAGGSFTYETTSNNNDFYAGIPSGKNIIYYNSWRSYNCQTIEAFKLTVAPSDSNSFSELAPFVNITTPPYDLHLQGSIPTQCENAGVPVNSPISITFDSDHDVRSVTTPDVGNDEFNGTGPEFIPPAISYAKLMSTSNTVERTLSNVTITDSTGVNGTTGTRPRIYYKRSTDANTWNNNTSATNGWKWQEADGSTSPFSFTIDYSLLYGGTGVTLGNIIQYFVVAQDIAAAPNVAIISGTFASNPYTVALPSYAFPIGGPINSYGIRLAIGGNVTVGSGGTYPSLTGNGGLFQDINLKVLTSNLVATIISDLTEAGTHALNQMFEECGDSLLFLTIQPDGAARSVTGNYAGGLIRFNGADRVTIDGLPGRLLTISNFSTLNATIKTLELYSGASLNSIKRCNIAAGSTSSEAYVCCIYANGAGNDYLTIDSNELTHADCAVRIYGTTVTDNKHNRIINNVIGSDYDWGYISLTGINVAYQTLFEIDGNEIKNMFYGYGPPHAIYLDYCNHGIIAGNYIHDIVFTGYSLGGVGIYLNADEGEGIGNPDIMINNNVLRRISGGSDVPSITEHSIPVAIRISGASAITSGIDIYYNSIYLEPDVDFGLSYENNNWCAGLIVESGPTGINFINNIIYNALGEQSGSSYITYGYAIYLPVTDPVSPFDTIDNNLYYVDNFDNNYCVLAGTAQPPVNNYTFAQWQSFTGQEANSIWADPQFTDNLLHLTKPGSPAIEAATPLSAVTDDYAGNDRHALYPTIGAHEYARTLIWLGYTTVWNSLTNWDLGIIPDDTYWAIIPQSPSGGNFPVIPDGVNAECYAIIIESGSNLFVEDGATFTIINEGP